MPGPVGALVAIMGQTNATLQWTEPTFYTYYGELYYEVLYVKLSTTVECSSKLQMTVNNITSKSFLHIKNLLPKTLYKFSVRAVSNISGPGTETTICNTTLPDGSVTTPSSPETTRTSLLEESTAVLQLVTQTSFDPTTVTEQASFQTPATTNILGTTQVMVCVNLVLQ